MISHALTIIINELEKHLTDTYGSGAIGAGAISPQVRLGNIAEGVGSSTSNTGAVPRDILGLSLVNIREEKTLKNVPNQTRNEVTLRVIYENPPKGFCTSVR
jgi:hypothetical protein